MAFKEYTYGLFKSDIKKLLRKRLNLKDKIRYHRQKANKFEQIELPKIEKKINDFLKRVEKKN
ncbi:hypothetical protein LCGC14_2256770 [marine sediment metagenome]|uniref:Uncharacterized protein n=1 Tax=marine sediment metagenome TaxID=412755 RepID=A0A0F9D0T5_9ZZZZ